MLKRTALVILGIAITVSLPAQTSTSDELKKKQQEVRKEVNNIKKELGDTRKIKLSGLSRLQFIQKKLRLLEQSVNNLNSQISITRNRIIKFREDKYRLENELEILKAQYRKSIIYAYKGMKNCDFLNFVFSASSFNDAYKRIEYLRSYRVYRKEQAENIRNTKLLLQQKINRLQVEKEEQHNFLLEKQKVLKEYENEKKTKGELISELKIKEKRLSGELAAKAKADRELQAGIQAAVLREMNKIKIEKPVAEKNKTGNEAGTGNKKSFELTPAAKTLSDNFEQNKGMLPWPVDKGVIKLHFGTYKIPALKVEGNNPGITLETVPGAYVKAVFDGKIITVFDVEGNTAVVVGHGKYFSTYSNLSSVTVKTGEAIKTGQILGKAVHNAGGNGEIEFVIMDALNKQNLDPEIWLLKN